MTQKTKTTSPSKKEATPRVATQHLELVRCESLRDFLHPEKGIRIKNMPYWILADEKERVFWFEFIHSGTVKEELLEDIRKGILYIRRSDAKAPETLQNMAL